MDTNKKRLRLTLIGNQKREYLFVLRFILADIHSSFNHLGITENISLPDHPESSVSLHFLETCHEAGDLLYRPPENPEKQYNISALLGLVAVNPTEITQRLDNIERALKEQGKEDIVKIQPKAFGVMIDVNALVRRWRKPR
jgi:hypothetical protein